MGKVAFRSVAGALLLLLLLFLSGCTRLPGGIAPSNIPLPPDGYTRLGAVKASDCSFRLLGLLPVTSPNYIHDAMDEALAKVEGADALVDITVERVTMYFILWSQTCTEVRATAVDVY
ncbi:MAG: hypothetical protein U0900_08045 [Myxococcota bacterium]